MNYRSVPDYSKATAKRKLGDVGLSLWKDVNTDTISAFT